MALPLIDAAGNTSDEEVGDSLQSSTVVPGQVSNDADSFMLLALATSHPTAGSAPTWSTPSGWTELRYETQIDLRFGLYWRRGSGVDTPFPEIPLSGNSEWSTVSIVVNDVDWTNGPIGDADYNNLNALPDLTTTQDKSAVVYVQAEEDNVSTLFTVDNPNQKLLGIWNQNATAEGVSNHMRAAWEFVYGGGTTLNGPTMGSNGDKRTAAIEVLTLGNKSPIAAVSNPSQALSPNNTGTQDGWIADFIATHNTHLDGTTLTAHTFDASSDVDTGTDQITITGHGMKTTTIVRAEANGNTLPTGLTDGAYYWVRWVDADTIELRATPGFDGINPDADAATDFYANLTTIYPTTVDLTAAGSGTCILREIRMINSFGANDFLRVSSGATANADGSGWVGDCGWLTNQLAYAFTWTTDQDFSGGSVVSMNLSISQTIIARYLVTFLDSDGDWVQWVIWERAVEGTTKNAFIQIEPSSTVAQSQALRSAGTFDASKTRYIILSFELNSGYSSATGRPGSVWDVTGLGLVTPFTVYGGSPANPLSLFQVAELLESLNDPVADTPSDLQIVLRQSVALGDGTNDIILSASEKSVAFPPLADGVTRFSTYRESLGVFVNATAGSEVSIRNSQIGATAPFAFGVTAHPDADLNLDGNAYVEGNVVLDSDFTYRRQLFVGGNGIEHNGAEISGSTFIVGSALGADSGMVEWDGSTSISNSAFELLDGVTTGHAVIITTPGTYTFNALTFTGFGADGTVTAAVYNNSGGSVTLNISGGSTPTVRNGAGASTTVVAGAQVTLTGLQAGSEVRAYVGTDPATATEIGGTESSGASFSFSQSYSGQDGYITILSLGYLNLRLPITYGAADVSIPIQQIVDRQYQNG